MREPGARDDPASAAEAEVGGSYASLPLGVVDERGGVGEGPPSPRAKHPPNPRTLPNGPRPHPYASERVEGSFSELLPEEVPGSSPRTPEASPYGGCAAPAAPLSCHRACASGPMGPSSRSRTAVVTGRRKGCSGKDVAQGAAGYRCAGAADGGAGADDLAFLLGRPRFSAGCPARAATAWRARTSSSPAPDPRCTSITSRRRPSRYNGGCSATSGPGAAAVRGTPRGGRVPVGRAARLWNAGGRTSCARAPSSRPTTRIASSRRSSSRSGRMGGIGRICSTRLFFYTKEL